MKQAWGFYNSGVGKGWSSCSAELPVSSIILKTYDQKVAARVKQLRWEHLADSCCMIPMLKHNYSISSRCKVQALLLPPKGRKPDK